MGLILFISGQEIFIIMLVVLLLFGADKIPEIARGIGKGMKDFRKAADEIKREIDTSTRDIRNEMSDIQNSVQSEINDISTNITKDVEESTADIKKNLDETFDYAKGEVDDINKDLS